MKIEVDVPDGQSGVWKVESFEVEPNDFSQMISMMKYGRGVPAGKYKRLMRGRECIMSNTRDEIRDFVPFINYAHGSVLINGLGLGVVVKALLKKPEITDITIIENSEDVIKLVAETYNKDPRVTIIHADCFEYKPPKGKRYNAVWHDIWDNICGDNIKEMSILHRKYGRITDYQESWCKDECKRLNNRDKRKMIYWR